MLNSRRSMAVLLGLVLIAQGCAVSSTDKVTKPGEAKSGFMKLSKAADLSVDQAKVLQKQTGKVIVGSFKVGFLTDNIARASTRGLSGGTGKATARVHLKGLTPEQMQQSANEIYQNFLSELKAKGYTVVTPEELASEPAYGALQDTGTSATEENVVLNLAPEGKVQYVAPDGMKLVYYLGEKKAAFAMSIDTIRKAQALAEKTGANVLAVNYVVNFVNAQTHGGISSASVKVGQGISMAIGSAVSVYTDSKTPAASVKLGQAVASEAEFAQIDNVTSKAGKAVGTAVNVASALLGGGTSQLEDYNLNIDQTKYAGAVKEVAEKTNQKIVERLAQARPSAP